MPLFEASGRLNIVNPGITPLEIVRTLMTDEVHGKRLAAFFEKEFTSENTDFMKDYMDIMENYDIYKDVKFKEKLDEIYRNYVADNAPKQVNISSEFSSGFKRVLDKMDSTKEQGKDSLKKIAEDLCNTLSKDNIKRYVDNYNQEMDKDLKAKEKAKERNLKEIIPPGEREQVAKLLDNYIDEKLKAGKNTDVFYLRCFSDMVKVGEGKLGMPFDEVEKNLEKERKSRLAATYQSIKSSIPATPPDGIKEYQDKIRQTPEVNQLHSQLNGFWNWLNNQTPKPNIGLLDQKKQENVQKSLASAFAFQLAGQHFLKHLKKPTSSTDTESSDSNKKLMGYIDSLKKNTIDLYPDPNMKITIRQDKNSTHNIAARLSSAGGSIKNALKRLSSAPLTKKDKLIGVDLPKEDSAPQLPANQSQQPANEPGTPTCERSARPTKR